MNNTIEFNSLEELYNRVKPALYSKVTEIKRMGMKYVNEKDIWNFLAENKWKKTENLQLHDIINDILYADNIDINNYALDKMKSLKEKQRIIIERNEENIL